MWRDGNTHTQVSLTCDAIVTAYEGSGRVVECDGLARLKGFGGSASGGETTQSLSIYLEIVPLRKPEHYFCLCLEAIQDSGIAILWRDGRVVECDGLENR